MNPERLTLIETARTAEYCTLLVDEGLDCERREQAKFDTCLTSAFSLLRSGHTVRMVDRRGFTLYLEEELRLLAKERGEDLESDPACSIED